MFRIFLINNTYLFFFLGIISRVDHIVDIGVDAVWLTPFFKSPMVDTGYDISNFTDVEPRFGTLHDFEQLSLEFRKRG